MPVLRRIFVSYCVLFGPRMKSAVVCEIAGQRIVIQDLHKLLMKVKSSSNAICRIFNVNVKWSAHTIVFSHFVRVSAVVVQGWFFQVFHYNIFTPGNSTPRRTLILGKDWILLSSIFLFHNFSFPFKALNLRVSTVTVTVVLHDNIQLADFSKYIWKTG